jgi:uncharacterized protein YycO
MNQTIAYHGILPCDTIIVPKSGFNIVQHFAVYIGQDFYGRDILIENKAGHGVRLVYADNFFNEAPTITRIEKFTGTNYERYDKVKRALQKIGKPYNLINYNCEHFAREVRTGIPSSAQVGTALGILALVGLVTLMAKS